jgi:hypothetical protein
MINESNEYLSGIAESAKKVERTLDTEGWRDVIRPAIQDRRASLLNSLVDEVEHGNVILIQQSIRAIDNLLSFVEVTLTEGDAAIQEGRRRQGLSEHPA